MAWVQGARGSEYASDLNDPFEFGLVTRLGRFAAIDECLEFLVALLQGLGVRVQGPAPGLPHSACQTFLK